MRICFLIRSLNYGGAERQLVELACGLKRCGHEVMVLTFYDDGPLGRDLETAGVACRAIGKRGRWDFVPFLVRLVRQVRSLRPDILHSYTTVPNMVVGLVAPFLPGIQIVWGVRASNLPPGSYDATVRASIWCGGRLARSADLIIANSWAGAADHIEQGYPAARMTVIPNGIETERFRPDPGCRARMRTEWGMAPTDLVIGNVARLDPVKDHDAFVRAAARVLARLPECRFVCVGAAEPGRLTALTRLAESLGLDRAFRWLPPTHDPVDVYRALDLHCSSSVSEGFSNSLGEALATGIPCVATNVGDAGRMLHGLGLVVPPGDSEALADAMLELLDRRSGILAERCRQRIVEEYSVPQLIARTESALARLLD